MTLSRRPNAPRLLAGLSLLLPLALVAALVSGSVDFSLAQAADGLAGFLRGDATSQEAIIIGQIRLPRALLAGLVGAILGISGAAMQGIFRNPLADPSLIGVTAGAALGASLMIAIGGDWVSGLSGLTLVSAGIGASFPSAAGAAGLTASTVRTTISGLRPSGVGGVSDRTLVFSPGATPGGAFSGTATCGFSTSGPMLSGTALEPF